MSEVRDAWEVVKNQSSNMSKFYTSLSFKIIEKLVDRDEAKQVKKLHPFKAFGKCPVCNESVTLRHHRQFCGECGSRLDWNKHE